MKKLLMILLFPLTVFAQNKPVVINKPVVCDKIEVVAQWMMTVNKNQKPFWVGKSSSQEVFYGMVVNERTGDWTIIEFNSEYACVLGFGEQNRLALPMN